MSDTAERWIATKTVFNAALELRTAERIDFVRAMCAGDDVLRDEVASLLARHASAGDFLDEATRERLRAGIGHPGEHQAGLQPGARLGAYRVVREIGRGGMGTVYLAERADAAFEKRVAIKLVTRGMDTDLVLRRFRHERQILAQLDHPNIARLLEGGTTDDGLPFFVMEYIEGVPIDQYCAARALSTEARLDLFREVCAAVHYAHQRLVVHRDIKPANVLVTHDGTPKLLDFGIAKLLTPEGSSAMTALPFQAMTPEYASPEQLAGALVTTLGDVYSLGVLLYQLLARQLPYPDAGHDPVALARAIETRAPARPSVVVERVSDATSSAHERRRLARTLRGDLDTVVLTTLRREPERRYASAQALRDDLHRYLRGLPVTARPDTVTYRMTKFVRRNRAAASIAGLSAVALVGAASAFAWQAHVANAHRRVAERRFAEVRALALALLFDVHDSVAAIPGTTRVRALIVTRSLTALDALAREDTSDVALQRDIAEGYLKVGDVQGAPYEPNLGETDAAVASYGRAASLLTPIVAHDPSDTTARRDLAAALTKMGAVALRIRRWSTAEREERQAIALLEPLLRRTPVATTDRYGVSDALIDLGDALAAADDQWSAARISAARDAYARALVVRTSLLAAAPRDPSALHAMSTAYTRLGYAASSLALVTGDTSQLTRSLESHRNAHALSHRLMLAEPGNPANRRRVADGWMDIAQVEQLRGDLGPALAAFDSAGPIFRSLAEADPANVEARRDLAYFHENLGGLLLVTHAPARAMREERAALALLRQIQHADRASVEEYYHIVHAAELLGDALAASGARDAARRAWTEASDALTAWERAEPNAVRTARLRAELAQRRG